MLHLFGVLHFLKRDSFNVRVRSNFASCRRYLTTINDGSDSATGKELEAGDMYERKTPHEHVLLRPGMYIGQIEPSSMDTWVYNKTSGRMEKESLSYSPALLKVSPEPLFIYFDRSSSCVCSREPYKRPHIWPTIIYFSDF